MDVMGLTSMWQCRGSQTPPWLVKIGSHDLRHRSERESYFGSSGSQKAPEWAVNPILGKVFGFIQLQGHNPDVLLRERSLHSDNPRLQEGGLSVCARVVDCSWPRLRIARGQGSASLSARIFRSGIHLPNECDERHRLVQNCALIFSE